MSTQTEKRIFSDSLIIDASQDRVWDILLGAETFPKWMAAFDSEMRFIGEWSEGSEVKICNANGEGMILQVEEHVSRAHIKLVYVAKFEKGKRVEFSGKDAEWKDAYESYNAFKLTNKKGGTLFHVESQCPQSWHEYYAKKYPLALEKIKQLAEAA